MPQQPFRHSWTIFWEINECTNVILLISLNELTNVYIDDISVFSANWDDHLKHRDLVFTCLKEEGLTIQAAKSQLSMNTCKFLGHVVGKGGTQQAKTRVVEEFRQPLN